MARPPHTVLSPKARLNQRSLVIVHIAQWWSLATGIWDKERALLIRWNGDPDRPLGNPVSHGHPTWFVLPNDLHEAVLDEVDDKQKAERARNWLAGEGLDITD